MSSLKTDKLGLNKWVPTDYVNMGEFNDNFQKIDDAHKDVTTQLAETEQEIGDKTNLPTWLQDSLREVVKAHDDYLRGIGINIKQPPYNVKGDGSDEYTKLQSALDDAYSKNLPLIIPNGAITYSQPLVAKVPIIGQDLGKSNLIFTGAGKAISYNENSGTTVDNAVLLRNMRISNLRITGNINATHGIYVEESRAGVFSELQFLDFNGNGAIAFQLNGRDTTLLDHIITFNVDIGIKLGKHHCDNITITRPELGVNSIAIDIDCQFDKIRILNGYTTNSQSKGINIATGGTEFLQGVTNSSGLLIEEFRFESMAVTAKSIITNVVGTNVLTNSKIDHIRFSSSTGSAIELSNTEYMAIDNCFFFQGSTSNTIKLDSTCKDISIGENNQIYHSNNPIVDNGIRTNYRSGNVIKEGVVILDSSNGFKSDIVIADTPTTGEYDVRWAFSELPTGTCRIKHYFYWNGIANNFRLNIYQDTTSEVGVTSKISYVVKQQRIIPTQLRV